MLGFLTNCIVFVFFVVVLAGCKVTTMQVEPEFENSKISNDGASCKFSISTFTDERKSKTIGVIGPNILESDIKSWLLSALEQFNISSIENAESKKLKLYLSKAYIESKPSTMAANVVIAAEVETTEDSYSKKRYFRGYEVNLNWNSSHSEVQSVMNDAISMSIQKLVSHYSETC